MMRAPRKILAVSAVLLAVGVCRPAHAGLIIDQSNSAGNTTSSGSTGVGESFVPTFNTINGVTVNLEVSTGGSSTVRIDLYSGSGYGGALLASTPSQIISSTTLATYEFDFAKPVTLTPNSTYTLEVTKVMGSDYGVQYYTSSSTAASSAAITNKSGTFFHSGGAADPKSDLVFAEGIATPEPPAILSAGTAILLGLGYTWRRRRNQA